ncbi:PD-(D/E)XK nuclease family transposase [Butyrivibrio sp. YAB3001]|uniref:PD-(D/E)XK nuclease family transposase n=1 Tax=Butyrivibrio sp. YAB3001 TaxID=1520812 RepID=UPI0008F66A6C|nr:PD-(D/E)XK nuclease family transposase [Butyrivibrio sp. YAB3001]SFC89967.1 PD-(D/E)XK nuclease family transposase [Butyrivibrio sp. YAB3001]
MKNNLLKKHFPVLRTENELLAEICSTPKLLTTFNSWNEEQQKEFLKICTGAKGVKMLYDAYFKEGLNPEYDPDRLSDMLSTFMKRKVKVKEVLPNDTTRLGDESSLIITDIVVELEGGTIANVEVQKIGYAYTGERASCYSADLLLRQYKRVRDQRKKLFTYKDVHPVYTIVFMENSPSIFFDYPECYVHYFQTTSNTGITLNMLQNFIFVPVDIFLTNLHNNDIRSDLDAWLTFLGCDEPEYIVQLIQKYPRFKVIYDDLYETCLNVERGMEMFSKELQILDRNTVTYMIDELQEELDTAKEELNNTKEELGTTKEQLDTTKEELGTTKEQLDTAYTTIADNEKTIAELQAELAKYKAIND